MADAARSPPGERLECREARGWTSRNGRRPTNPQFFHKDLQVVETDSPEQAHRATGALAAEAPPETNRRRQDQRLRQARRLTRVRWTTSRRCRRRTGSSGS